MADTSATSGTFPPSQNPLRSQAKRNALRETSELTFPTDNPPPTDRDPIPIEYRAYQTLVGSANATTTTNNNTTKQEQYVAPQGMDSEPFVKTTSVGDAAGDAANGDGGDAMRTNSEGLSPPASPPSDRRLSREWGE